MISIVGVLQQVCHHAAQKIHQDGRARNHEARREESAPGTSKTRWFVVGTCILWENLDIDRYTYTYTYNYT